MLSLKPLYFILPLLPALMLACTTEPSDQTAQATAEEASTSFSPLDEVIGLNETWTGGLDSMIARRRIRALVPYSPTSYYIDGAERQGISYEAMTYFEEYLNNKLEGPDRVKIVFIPLTRNELIPALLEGYGDIVAANLTITPERKEEVAFTTPVLTGAREVLATGPAAPAIDGFEELTGRTVHIRKSSSFYEHIRRINDSLQQKGMPVVKVEFVDEHFEDEDILEMVNAGLLSMTVIDEHKGKLWAQVFPHLKIHDEWALHSGSEIAWAIRPGNPRFEEVLNAFIRENRKGTMLGNILFNRYLKDADYVQDAFSPEGRERFIATRDLFMKYGKKYQLDWLMLAAQGYQESRLNQQLVSPAGAVGIMQIKPTTAADPNVGVYNIQTMENNIKAGAKYLRFLIDRYFVSPEIDSLNAGLLAMAAYNAGPQRVIELRKKAARHGLNPNVWFDNVELIAAREIGRETVQYVSNIYKYYTSYRSLARYVQQTGKPPFRGW